MSLLNKSRISLHLTGKFHCEELYRDKSYSNVLYGLYQTQLLHTNLCMVQSCNKLEEILS